MFSFGRNKLESLLHPENFENGFFRVGGERVKIRPSIRTIGLISNSIFRMIRKQIGAQDGSLEYTINNQLPLQVLLNDLVLGRLFDFLSVADLKNCRSVCKQWLSSSELNFRQRTRIFFEFSQYENNTREDRDSDIENLTLEKLTEFLEQSTRNVALNAIGFKGQVSWTISELMEFFNNPANQFEDFKLENVVLKDDNQQKIRIYDFSQLLRQQAISNLTCLIIENVTNGPEYIISVKQIENVKHLYLLHCSIKLDGGKISPKKLMLFYPSFYRGEMGNKLTEIIVVNEFVNFEKTKELELVHKYSKMSLDMGTGSNINLNSVYLVEVSAVNWQTANWNIGVLSLDFKMMQDLRERLTMNVNEVHLYLKHRSSSQVIKYFPESIKRLSIKCVWNSVLKEMDMDNPVYFPNLKYIKMSTEHISLFPMFSHCPELTDLELTYGRVDEINLNLIPENINRLKLHYDREKLVSLERRREFQVFVLNLGDINTLGGVLKHFQPEKFAVHHVNDFQWSWNKRNFEIIKKTILGEYSTQQFVPGELEWKDTEELLLDETCLAESIGLQTKYIMYTNGKATPISRSEFENFVK